MRQFGFAVYVPLFILGFMLHSCIDNEGAIEDEVYYEDDSEQQAEQDNNRLAELNQKITKDPNNPNLYYSRAKELMDRRELKKALNDIERCVMIDSTVAQFHFLKAEIHFKRMEPREAKRSFETCLRLDETHSEAKLKLGEIYLLLRDHEKALGMINEVISDEPQKASAYFMKGFIYEEMQDTINAVSAYQTATELNSNYYEAHMALGLLYSHGRNGMAIDYFNNALEVRPNSLEARYNIAYFLQQAEQFNEAIDVYKDIIELAKDMRGNDYLSRAYHNIGYIYLAEAEMFEDAMPYFEKAIDNTPDYFEAHYNLGLAYEEIGEYDEAERRYRTALQIRPSADLPALGLERVIDNRK